MGITRLSWKEIDAWLNVREKIGEIPLKDYEVSLIRQMSEAYSSEYSQASDKAHPAPYSAETLDGHIDRAAVKNKLTSILGSFGKPDSGPKYEVEPN